MVLHPRTTVCVASILLDVDVDGFGRAVEENRFGAVGICQLLGGASDLVSCYVRRASSVDAAVRLSSECIRLTLEASSTSARIHTLAAVPRACASVITERNEKGKQAGEIPGRGCRARLGARYSISAEGACGGGGHEGREHPRCAPPHRRGRPPPPPPPPAWPPSATLSAASASPIPTSRPWPRRPRPPSPNPPPSPCRRRARTRTRPTTPSPPPSPPSVPPYHMTHRRTRQARWASTRTATHCRMAGSRRQCPRPPRHRKSIHSRAARDSTTGSQCPWHTRRSNKCNIRPTAQTPPSSSIGILPQRKASHHGP